MRKEGERGVVDLFSISFRFFSNVEVRKKKEKEKLTFCSLPSLSSSKKPP